MKKFFIIFALIGVSCATQKKELTLGNTTTDLNSHDIPFNFTPKQITSECKLIIDKTSESIAKIGNSTANPVMEFERILAAFDVVLTPYIFANSVHTDETVRKSSLACKKLASEFYINTFTNKELYKTIKGSQVTGKDHKRLKSKMVLDFEDNGLKLNDKKLKEVKKLLKRLSKLSTDFSNNIKEDKSKLIFTKAELQGLPQSVLDIYKKDTNGNFIVTTAYPEYSGVMKYAKNSSVRKKTYIMRNTRAPQNKAILSEVIEKRRKVADISGFKNWADYQTSNGRMAKNSQEIWSFINNLKSKLKTGTKKDLAKLLKFKRNEKLGNGPIQIWDLSYISNLYKKKKFNFDSEKVREFFPSKYVVGKMFEVYSKLLGVEFKEIRNAKTWHETVSVYKVIDKQSQKDVAYFYTDFIPRKGKYSHAAAFTLRSGRLDSDGHYIKPISAIVANFTPGTDKKPSLLSHSEVRTLFHEFGHIMHQTLTKAPFSYLSGTAVERDFVEAPSQMLEEWIWNEDIINLLSGHYLDHSKKLPKESLDKLLKLRQFNLAYNNTAQLYFGTVDMTFHSKKLRKDLAREGRIIFKQTTGMNVPKQTHQVTSFGHLMGYSAGYYGYLWSKVYAIDMFSVFKENGFMNPEIGMRYRKEILEKGSIRDAKDSLKAFLKREPNQKPFYEWLGITD